MGDARHEATEDPTTKERERERARATPSRWSDFIIGALNKWINLFKQCHERERLLRSTGALACLLGCLVAWDSVNRSPLFVCFPLFRWIYLSVCLFADGGNEWIHAMSHILHGWSTTRRTIGRAEQYRTQCECHINHIHYTIPVVQTMRRPPHIDTTEKWVTAVKTTSFEIVMHGVVTSCKFDPHGHQPNLKSIYVDETCSVAVSLVLNLKLDTLFITRTNKLVAVCCRLRRSSFVQRPSRLWQHFYCRSQRWWWWWWWWWWCISKL